MWDMHSEGWWIRALDGELTLEEQADWEQHLRECARCRADWEALARLDTALRRAPRPVPPVGLALKTTAQAAASYRRRRSWLLLGVVALTVLLGAAGMVALGIAYWDFNRILAVMLFSREVLFEALIQTLVGLMAAGHSFSLLALALAAALLALFMPHGVLATITMVMLRRQREAISA